MNCGTRDTGCEGRDTGCGLGVSCFEVRGAWCGFFDFGFGIADGGFKGKNA